MKTALIKVYAVICPHCGQETAVNVDDAWPIKIGDTTMCPNCGAEFKVKI